MKRVILFITFVVAPMIVFSQHFIEERALTEINKAGRGDYSPWISGDGLRLYYVRETDNAAANLLTYTYRRHTDSLFKSPITIPFSPSSTIYSIELTYDELDLYYSDNSGNVFYCHRDNLEMPFSNPVAVIFTGFSPINLPIAPTLTGDKTQLFFNNGREIHQFAKVSPTGFSFTRSTRLPEAFAYNNTGKLSKDGLNFYVYEVKQGLIGGLVKIRRASTTEGFDSGVTESGGLLSAIEFSMTNEMDFVVYVKWVSYERSSYDLFIAKKDLVTSTLSDVPSWSSSFRIYPNSTAGRFNISMQSTHTITVEVYNSFGNTIFQNRNFNIVQSNEIDLTGQPSGVYFVKVSDGNKLLGMEKLVIE